MDFYIVDVFAEEKCQGNQLAVFVPDHELTAAEMQQIAKEINFSETSFILSSKQENGGYDVRIFTPDVEVPFAGHPTLGTAYVINKIIDRNEETEIILNLEVGQIPVSINGDKLTMSQNKPLFGMTIKETDIVANVLNIKQEDIRTDYPIQLVSTGLPCIIVPLKSLDAVKRCAIHHSNFQHFISTMIKCNLLVFAPEAEKEENDLRVRVFMDDPGFFEDPATGSANGNLAGYLLEHQFFQASKINLQIEQGYEMQRPSLIRIDAEKINGKFHIHVGGKVFFVAKGEWM